MGSAIIQKRSRQQQSPHRNQEEIQTPHRKAENAPQGNLEGMGKAPYLAARAENATR